MTISTPKQVSHGSATAGHMVVVLTQAGTAPIRQLATLIMQPSRTVKGGATKIVLDDDQETQSLVHK